MKVGLFELMLENHSYARLTLIEKKYRENQSKVGLATLIVLTALASVLLVYQFLDDHGIAELNNDVLSFFAIFTGLVMGAVVMLGMVGTYIETALKKAMKVYTDTLLEGSEEGLDE